MNIFYNKNHILFHFVLKDISNPLLLPSANVAKHGNFNKKSYETDLQNMDISMIIELFDKRVQISDLS